ncbi:MULTISPECIES: LuxR family transcriptional regulator [Bradyrhizobium]|uniref:LuxR family transcriptional regulator n=1 Tax=Bradyrhizobium TaxID=374 RepID=UPI001FE23121|nr:MULTISPECIES: LuxR family transcriptional regulator [Bradyrhizobium]
MDDQSHGKMPISSRGRESRGPDLFSFVECAIQTQSIKALFDLLVNCSSNEGFDKVAYGALTRSNERRLPEYLPPPPTINFPSDWCQRYAEQEYRAIDPVVRRTAMLPRPFLWDELTSLYELQPRELRVLHEAREAGLKHGISVPLFGSQGRLAFVSFASPFDDADPRARIDHLTTLASAFHNAVAQITPPLDEGSKTDIPLTERETECLYWVAEGKSAWVIGKVVEVSPNTVNFHMKNVIRKLGAANRTNAVAIATRRRLI